MTDLSHSRLQCLLAPENLSLLTQIQRGTEKEGLRVTPSATIAQSKHPKALGSPLTHPCITTDYSEALLEFITPVFQNVEGCIDY
ncbi:MAG: glutamate--cysteine ligase, partial [Paraglaciecola chathamensis]